VAGRPTKEFHEYLIAAPGNTHVNHSEYIQEPATAFLSYVVEAKFSVDMCLRKFKANKYFSAFGLNRQFYGNSEIKRLRTLWQLRHSNVHTGGTITVPDAQKVPELAASSGKTIAFENNFIYEVARKIHPLVKMSTEGIGGAFKQLLKPGVEQSITSKIDELFKVRSSVNVWLR
jgi:hypothetical protein